MFKRALILAAAVSAALFCSACSNTVGESAAVVTIEPTTYDAAEFKTVRDNRSVYDGSALVFESYYEKITLEQICPQYAVINAAVEADCRQFFEDHDALTEAAISEHEQSGCISVKTVSAQVTRNSGGIISVKMSRNETINETGDTYTRVYGMSFDLNTGKELTLADALDMDADSAAEFAKEQTREYIGEHREENWYSSEVTDAVIDGYTIEQFDFYIQNSNVCLCYPSGTLSDSVIVVTYGK